MDAIELVEWLKANRRAEIKAAAKAGSDGVQPEDAEAREYVKELLKMETGSDALTEFASFRFDDDTIGERRRGVWVTVAAPEHRDVMLRMLYERRLYRRPGWVPLSGDDGSIWAVAGTGQTFGKLADALIAAEINGEDKS